MKMELNEAIDKLNKAGLIVEGLDYYTKFLNDVYNAMDNDPYFTDYSDFYHDSIGAAKSSEIGDLIQRYWDESIDQDVDECIEFIKKELEMSESVNENADDPYTIMRKKLEDLENELLMQGFKAKLIDRPGAFYVKVDAPSCGNVIINYSIKDKSFTISDYDKVLRTYKEDEMEYFDKIVEFLA